MVPGFSLVPPVGIPIMLVAIDSWSASVVHIVPLVCAMPPLATARGHTYQRPPTSGMEDVVAFNEGFARVIDIAHHFDEPAYRALMDEVMGKVAQRPDDIGPLHERVGQV